MIIVLKNKEDLDKVIESIRDLVTTSLISIRDVEIIVDEEFAHKWEKEVEKGKSPFSALETLNEQIENMRDIKVTRRGFGVIDATGWAKQQEHEERARIKEQHKYQRRFYKGK